ncbi:ATP-binding cassette domain-containing protein [Bacillus paranthracis]|uniref:ABC transporter ATP-binding protein n=1 Tax=Bacillus cereus group TaxID=86661 RepID=UPI0022E19AC5|nr:MULTISPECIES: ABC transporter ATP-binding protein [Bacillus cereus group]MBL3845665.1 ABC transporter ATP-binding protein [Bacillus cereus]MDA1889876.1 ABC transporter ATP-binding protein [Bacillus cereus group sp. BY11-1LC]MDA2589689.1 ABC transporter ATP-binding protein [Bacillus cereus group sp. Bc065]MDK7439967.1 ABC transporter ATP-binding protein [Bacillus paranthracis]MDK7456188.1 ABC transporter ATP-binding protein [Bacillus paranthracis]
MIALETKDITKKYKKKVAVNEVTISLEEHKIYGLLGRNGAGKTTLLNLLAGQITSSSGSVSIFGEHVFENNKAMQNICFVRVKEEAQLSFKVKEIFKMCSMFYKNWDGKYAEELANKFQLNMTVKYHKLSHGMQTVVGIIQGLASRAPITIFDEPTTGLDAAHRELFYSLLLEDYGEYPRTIILSTHLVEEVTHVIEDVIIIKEGRLVVQSLVEDLLQQVQIISGQKDKVDEFLINKKVLNREVYGNKGIAVIWEELSNEDYYSLEKEGLAIDRITLQKLFIHITGGEVK